MDLITFDVGPLRFVWRASQPDLVQVAVIPESELPRDFAIARLISLRRGIDTILNEWDFAKKTGGVE